MGLEGISRISIGREKENENFSGKGNRMNKVGRDHGLGRGLEKDGLEWSRRFVIGTERIKLQPCCKFPQYVSLLPNLFTTSPNPVPTGEG